MTPSDKLSPTGKDPVAFIISANIQRRHLTKGQSAMAIAKALFVTNKNQTDAAKEIGVSQSRVAYAIVVLKHLPDLANEVLVGGTTLDVAYAGRSSPGR